MAADRTIPKLALLSDDEITAITDTALRILDEIGVKILDDGVLRLLADTPGAAPDRGQGVVRFSPELDQARAADA
jgi:trimethylamine:corrinoid methyltransferase-like protein